MTPEDALVEVLDLGYSDARTPRDRFADLLVEVLMGPRGQEIAELVADLAPQLQRERHQLEPMLLEVARHFGVTPARIRGPSRRAPLPDARATFVALARARSSSTYVDIARAMNKDHSTAIAAHRRSNQVIRDAVCRLTSGTVPGPDDHGPMGGPT